MIKKIIISLTIGGLVLFCLLAGVGLLVIKAMWAWVVPDLFPGAVEGGLVAREITWWMAGKLAIVLVVFGVLTGSCRGGKRSVNKSVHVSAGRCRDGGGPEVIDATVSHSTDDD